MICVGGIYHMVAMEFTILRGIFWRLLSMRRAPTFAIAVGDGLHNPTDRPSFGSASQTQKRLQIPGDQSGVRMMMNFWMM